MILPPIYPILDTESLAARQCPVEQATDAWLDAGASILQFRHKGHWSRALFEQARRTAERCRAHSAILIIDDRADIAALLQAGLHLGQDDLTPAEARTVIAPEALLGFSSHNVNQLCAALSEPVSYIAFGPIFLTRSKRNPDPVVGLAELSKCRALSKKPLVAIGGITRQNAADVFAAGADAVAVIGDMLPEDCSYQSLRERMEQWQQLGKKLALA